MRLDESEKKKTILLVEDEGIIALNVQERLSKMGFRVPLFVSTGEAAIREAEKLSPDLVLLDIRLAGLMSGIEAAQIIRERFDIPVVFMTSHSDHMTIRDSLTAFPYGYILKPVKDADLLTMIGSALARKELEVRVKNQERELIHTDRLASLGRLIAGVAHELSNPNQAILFHVEIVEQIAKDILSACDGEAERISLSSGLDVRDGLSLLSESASGLKEASKRISSFIAELKDYIRTDEFSHAVPVDMNAVVRSSVLLSKNLIKRATDAFHLVLDPSLPPVLGLPQRLEQVIINLIQNSCDALSSRDQELRIESSYAPDERRVIVTVSDSGCGMDAAVLSHITEPFFTTNRDRGGTGLGIPISAGILKEHLGSLSFQSSPGEGTVAVVSLPVLENQP